MQIRCILTMQNRGEKQTKNSQDTCKFFETHQVINYLILMEMNLTFNLYTCTNNLDLLLLNCLREVVKHYQRIKHTGKANPVTLLFSGLAIPCVVTPPSRTEGWPPAPVYTPTWPLLHRHCCLHLHPANQKCSCDVIGRNRFQLS